MPNSFRIITIIINIGLLVDLSGSNTVDLLKVIFLFRRELKVGQSEEGVHELGLVELVQEGWVQEKAD